jgi:hypothetical protein
MGGNLILGWIKAGLAAVICVLLVLVVAQRDRLERRMRDVETKLDRLTRELEDMDVSRPVARQEAAEADPRTLAYVPSADNLLADPAIEPAPPPDAPRGGTIHFFFGSNPRSLNGYVLNEAQLRNHAERFIYEYLARRSKTNPDLFVPGLANRVTINDDKTVVTIHLRKGRFWHRPHLTPEEQRGPLKWLAELAPQEVTADDVKFTIDTVRSKYSETPLRSYVLDVEKVEVVDRYTVGCRPTNPPRSSNSTGSTRRCAAPAPSASRASSRTSTSACGAAPNTSASGPRSTRSCCTSWTTPTCACRSSRRARSI